jgi:hypothetical protein
MSVFAEAIATQQINGEEAMPVVIIPIVLVIGGFLLLVLALDRRGAR